MADSVSIQIVDGSGDVLGSFNQFVGSLFTSGSKNWNVRVPFTGQPSACNVKTMVNPSPGLP